MVSGCIKLAQVYLCNFVNKFNETLVPCTVEWTQWISLFNFWFQYCKFVENLTEALVCKDMILMLAFDNNEYEPFSLKVQVFLYDFVAWIALKHLTLLGLSACSGEWTY